MQSRLEMCSGALAICRRAWRETNRLSLPSPHGVVSVEGFFVKLVESSLWNAKSIDFSLFSFAVFSLLLFLLHPPALPAVETLAFVGFERNGERESVSVGGGGGLVTLK